MGCWIAVTIEAPLHLEWLSLEGERHLIDPAVTCDARNTAIDMNRVIEKDIVRNLCASIPANWLSARETLAHGGENRRPGIEVRVAGHAGLCRWKTCFRADLHLIVTISAIDAVIADMVFVAEGNRLVAWPSDPGHIGGIDVSSSKQERAHRADTEQENYDP